MAALFAYIRQFLSVPRADENPELLKAQFEVFARHIPLMYSILLVSTWAIAFLGQGIAPNWLVIYIPVFFTVLSLLRILDWYKARGKILTAELAYKALVRTNMMAAIMAILIGAWAMALYQYGDYYMRVNVAFFMATTGVSIVVCVLHLRSAAFMIAIIVNIPLLSMLFSSGNPSLVVMAVETMLVSATLLMVVFVQARYFVSSVQARAELEAVSKENYDLANLDSLTGLANRRQFFSCLNKGMRLRLVRRSKSLRVLLIWMASSRSMIFMGILSETIFCRKPVNVWPGFLARIFWSPDWGGDEFALLTQRQSGKYGSVGFGRPGLRRNEHAFHSV